MEMISEDEGTEILEVKQHSVSEDHVHSIQSQVTKNVYQSSVNIQTNASKDHKEDVKPQEILKVNETSEIIKTIEHREEKKDIYQQAHSTNIETVESKVQTVP